MNFLKAPKEKPEKNISEKTHAKDTYIIFNTFFGGEGLVAHFPQGKKVVFRKFRPFGFTEPKCKKNENVPHKVQVVYLGQH